MTSDDVGHPETADSASVLYEWGEVIPRLVLNAQRLESPLESYVDTPALLALTSPSNQLLYGRRGTGKTHLLRALKQIYVENFAELQTVPMLINGQELRDLETGEVRNPQLRAIQLYVGLLGTVSRELNREVQEQITPGLFDRLFGGPMKDRKRRAELAAEDLAWLLEHGVVVYLPQGRAGKAVKELSELEESTSAGVEANLSANLLDPAKVGISIAAGHSFKTAEAKSIVKTAETEGRVRIPVNEIGELLGVLLSALGDVRLVLLFDEWSEVDYGLDPQPYLLEMLRRTMSAESRVRVKLACIPTRTKLSTTLPKLHNPIGFQIDNDVYVGATLDDAVYVENDLAQLFPFFLSVLHVHLASHSDLFRALQPDEFRGLLFGDILESEHVFLELLKASSAVPRDFLNVVTRSNAVRVAEGEATIRITHVRTAARDLVKGIEQELRKDDRWSSAAALFEALFTDFLAPKKTTFMSVSDTVAEHELMRVLWDRRLITEVPSSLYDLDTNQSLRVISLHYGKCVDLLEALSKQKGVEQAEALAETFFSYRVPEFHRTRWFGTKVQHAVNFVGSVVESNSAAFGEAAARLELDRPGESEVVRVRDDEFWALVAPAEVDA